MEAAAPPRRGTAEFDYEALRAELRRALGRTPLGRFAGEASLSEEDVVQEAIARLIAEIESKGAPPRDPDRWLFRAATNYIKDRIKLDAIHPTSPHEPGAPVFEANSSEAGLEELVEARLSQAEFADIRDRLDREEAAMVVLREAGLTVRGAAEVLGRSKSSCQERLKAALDKIAVELEARRGRPAERRVRELATAIVAGTLSSRERANAAREMEYNLALRAEVSQLRRGLHEVATLIPLEEALAHQASQHGLMERAALFADKAREQAYAWAGRGSGHEAEAAGGVAAGGTSAGLATKAIVAACIGGAGAAGVGGACVATGVVDLPGKDSGRPAAEKTVIETTSTEPTATSTTPAMVPPTTEAAQVAATPDKPVEQVNKELYGGGGSSGGSSGSTSGSRDFGAPVGNASTSGGGGGGSSGSRENFGP